MNGELAFREAANANVQETEGIAARLAPLDAKQIKHADGAEDDVGHPSRKLGGELRAVGEGFADLVQHHVERAYQCRDCYLHCRAAFALRR